MQEDLDVCPIADSADLAQQVPVVDVSAIVADPGSADARGAVDEIAMACREWGFFQVVNHAIPTELTGKTLAQMRAFFAAPRSVRESVMRSRENPWGYYNHELTKNQRDKKEVFDFTTEGRDPIYGAENRWPDADDPGIDFVQTMRAYRDAVTGLSLSLLEAFCVGLDLPPDFMRADFARNHTGFIRLNYYPVKDPLPDSSVARFPVADLGVHHHTDAGALTVLLQDKVGGLQVFKDGFWHNVKVIDEAFVVNTGDMMQVWSNDNYKAAIHRVLAMDTVDRFSIPFFFNPSAETVVEPLPTVVGCGNPPLYRGINWSDFRGRRTDGDYADYGPEVQIAQYRI